VILDDKRRQPIERSKFSEEQIAYARVATITHGSPA
jgi:hypothetical protein